MNSANPKPEPLPIEVVANNRFVLLRIPGEDCGRHGDLTELVELVERMIREGKKDMVAVFTESAYLYTRAIAALVRCYARVDDAGGTFRLVATNPHMLNAIKLAGVDKMIKTFESEDQIPE